MASEGEGLIKDENPRDFPIPGKNIVEEMKAELGALDQSFVHSIRLLEEEIKKLSSNHEDSSQAQKEKIFISQEDQKTYNLVGRLLGPKGLTLKRIQAETSTKMSILGRGSIKDRSKEEELRTSGNSMYAHLNEELHVLIEAGPPSSINKIAAGAAEVRKMLIPPEPGQSEYASKYDYPPPPSGRSPYDGPPGFRGPPPSHYGGSRGGYQQPSKGGRSRMGGKGRGGGGGGGRRDDRRSGDGGQWGGDDSWRDGTISKDYNHGVSGGYGAEKGASSYGSDPYGGADTTGYFSSFTDTSTEQGGGPYGTAHNGGRSEWKSSHGARRDYRYHPYDQGGANPSSGTSAATGYY